MKALMKTAPGVGNFEIRDIKKPEVTEEDNVLIRVSAAGVCGTDVHILHDEYRSYPPVVLGHEFSGVVEGVRDGVTSVKPGDRVVCEPFTRTCGRCAVCRSGKIQLCESKRSPGWGIDGAFTDYVVVPDINLHKIPDGVDDVTAALCEPLAICVTAVLEKGHVEPRDTVAIIGAGPIGMLSAVAAKAGGAARTVMVGVNADEALRFKIAKKLGVDRTVNAQREDLRAVIDEMTDGKGVDCVIEASGAEGGINNAISIVKRCGRITVAGMPSSDRVGIEWKTMVDKNLDVSFSLSSNIASWDRALSIMADPRFDISPIATHMVNISDWERAFDDIAKGRAIKVMFIPGQQEYFVKEL